MIFVTVGNARQPFTRLVEAVDALARRGAFGGEEVLLQSGHDTTAAPYCTRRPFLSMDEFQRALVESTLVIGHAGWGTLAQAVRVGKVPVAMPRRSRFGEHVNDHQLELAQAFGSVGRCAIANEAADLPDAIAESRRRQGQGLGGQAPASLELVERAIEELVGRPGRGPGERV